MIHMSQEELFGHLTYSNKYSLIRGEIEMIKNLSPVVMAMIMISAMFPIAGAVGNTGDGMMIWFYPKDIWIMKQPYPIRRPIL